MSAGFGGVARRRRVHLPGRRTTREEGEETPGAGRELAGSAERAHTTAGLQWIRRRRVWQPRVRPAASTSGFPWPSWHQWREEQRPLTHGLLDRVLADHVVNIAGHGDGRRPEGRGERGRLEGERGRGEGQGHGCYRFYYGGVNPVTRAHRPLPRQTRFIIYPKCNR